MHTVEKLEVIANYLDSASLFEEADEVDELINIAKEKNRDKE